MATATLNGRLTMDSAPFRAGLQRSIGAANNAGRTIGNSLKNIATAPLSAVGAALAGVFAVGKFTNGIKAALDLGGSLSDLSAQTGESTGNLLILRKALDDAGVGADSAGLLINKMQMGMASGGKAIEALGVHLSALQSKGAVAQMAILAQKLSAIEDPTERAARAMAIFGKQGGKALSFLTDGSALGNANATLGKQVTILNATAGAFDRISDLIGSIGNKTQGFWVGMAAGIQGPLGGIMEGFNKMDFAVLGLNLGRTLAKAANVFVGAFANPGAALDVFGNALQAYLRQNVNGFVAGMKMAGDTLLNYFRALPGIITLVSQGLGYSLSAAALRFSASLMEAMGTAAAALMAGVMYVSTVGISGLKAKLLESGLAFAKAVFLGISGKVDGVEKMLGAALGDAAGSVAGATFGDIFKAQSASIAKSFETDLGGASLRAALKAKGAFTLAFSAFDNIALGKFEPKDVAGAGAYAAKASAGLTGLQVAGANIHQPARARAKREAAELACGRGEPGQLAQLVLAHRRGRRAGCCGGGGFTDAVHVCAGPHWPTGDEPGGGAANRRIDDGRPENRRLAIARLVAGRRIRGR